MAKFVTVGDQKWESAQLAGLTVEECRLWQEENLYAGIFRLPTGFQFPYHSHQSWVQIFVLSGRIRVELPDNRETRSITAGEYYFVEPGDPHIETVEEDLTAFVITAENREALYGAFI